jgi:hypothetical protein
MTLKLITVDDTVKTNVPGFRDNFSCDVQKYIWNDQACDNLSGKKDCSEMRLLNLPAVMLWELC